CRVFYPDAGAGGHMYPDRRRVWIGRFDRRIVRCGTALGSRHNIVVVDNHRAMAPAIMTPARAASPDSPTQVDNVTPGRTSRHGREYHDEAKGDPSNKPLHLNLPLETGRLGATPPASTTRIVVANIRDIAPSPSCSPVHPSLSEAVFRLLSSWRLG